MRRTEPAKNNSPVPGDRLVNSISLILKNLNNHMRVSIIVPVYNGANSLAECLTALKALACPDIELIVVDDASTDDTPSIAEQAGVKVLRLAKNAGPGAARNYGARHSLGEILFFVDADVALAPGALNRARKVLREQPD